MRRMCLVYWLMTVVPQYAMDTIVKLPDEKTLKQRLRQAGLDHFEKNTYFSCALTDDMVDHTLDHIVTTIKQATHSYRTAMLRERCSVPEELFFEVVLQDNKSALKILKKQGIYKKH